MTKSEFMAMDRVDYRILSLLTEQGRQSDVAIGDEVGLSSNAVARRRRLMEEDGIIKGYSANVDLDRIGCGILVLVQFELTSQADEALMAFEKAIESCTAVSKCWFVSGDVDFLAFVHVASLQDYDKTYREQLAALPNVSRIRSSFALRNVFDRPVAPDILKFPL